MRKYLAPILLLCIILLISVKTADAETTVSWTAPTQRTDGTPLLNLAGFVIHWGTAPGEYTQSVRIEDPAVLRHVIETLPPGTWYFAAQAFDANGLISDYSDEASKVIPDAPPAPPTGLTVLSPALFAYTLVQSENRIALVPAGTVPPGTPCDSSQSVRDSNGVLGYVVPKSAVDWAGTVRAEVVVAECG